MMSKPQLTHLGRNTFAPVLAGALTLLLVGHSPAAAAPAKERASAQAVVVKFAYVPNPGIAAVFVGLDRGFFRAEGIELVPKEVTAAQLTPSIMSGESDVSFDAVQGVLGNVSNGAPLQILAQISTNQPGSAGGTGRLLLVKKESSIRTLGDLAGKKVAFQRLGAAGDTALQVLLQKIDSGARANVLALPATAMEAALLADNVDAVQVTDPQASQMLTSGQFRSLGDPPLLAFGAAPDKVLTVTTAWAGKNRSVIARFQRALKKSAEYAQKNPNSVRKVMVYNWKTPSALAVNTRWPRFTTVLNMRELAKVYAAMRATGYIAKPVNLTSLVIRRAK